MFIFVGTRDNFKRFFMKNSELIKKIHEDLKSEGLVTHYSESKRIFELTFQNLSNEIINGKKIAITNFGTFHTRIVKKNTFKKGERINLWTLFFKSSEWLKSKLNED